MTVSGFVEIADRCWVARSAWLDVNVTVVAGETGLVVVDTHASARAGGELAAGVRELSRLPLVAVVNTHDHFDHVLGNGAFLASLGSAPVIAHEQAAASMPDTIAEAQRHYRDGEGSGDPHGAEVLATAPVLPDRTFSSVRVVDLGGRVVELVHPGRGHTAGDLVVAIPDAAVVLTGDLVEESAPPSYGEDCWPLEWPATLDLLVGLVGPDTVVVPGHGSPVRRDFVEDQRADVARVAETIHSLAADGVPEDRALERGSWPFAPERLATAVRRGYAQLPPGARRLPLA